jgi:hypothetical protein
MGYLFWGLGDHRPPANRKTSQTKQHLKIEQADEAVLADFITLQSVWRRQGTLRRTSKGTLSSREERQAWKHLIQHLTNLPAPRD